MAGRKVGKGRGSVYAGGKVYLEGASVPSDVEVDDVVFTDLADDADVASSTVASQVIGPDGPVTDDADEPAADTSASTSTTGRRRSSKS